MSLRPTIIATSLKMYFGLERTLDWVDAILRLDVPEDVELVVVPSFLAIPAVVERVSDSAIGVGGQNLYPADAGAFTGEVSGSQLREAGCRFAEVGHAERARLFGETDADVAAKLSAAWRNGLCPILCVGESACGSAAEAGRWCARRLEYLLDAADVAGGLDAGRDLIVAYEPVWAIGAETAASTDHVTTVIAALRQVLSERQDIGDFRIIYGGSAGAGLLTELRDVVDGLFLGRFAHDPTALKGILLERTSRHSSVGAESCTARPRTASM